MKASNLRKASIAAGTHTHFQLVAACSARVLARAPGFVCQICFDYGGDYTFEHDMVVASNAVRKD